MSVRSVGSTGPAEQFPVLTSLRFFAALHVLFFHYLPPVADQWPRLKLLASHGYISVSFFFVLSGFVLAHAEGSRVQNDASRFAFWRRRVARIYPLYVLAFLAYAPFVVAHRFAVDPPAQASLKLAASAVTNLLALQAWLPPLSSAWNAPSWSISVEAFFYLSFPWLLRRLKPRRLLLALGVTWASAIVVPLIYTLLRRTPPFGEAWMYTAAKYCPLLHLPAFAFGMLLYQARERLRAAPGSLLLATLALALVLLVAPASWALMLHNGALLPLHGVLVLAGTASGPLQRALSHSALTFLGNASYALYILQVPTWRWTSPWLAPLGANTAVFVYYGVALLTAVAAHVLVERPARRLIARLPTALNVA